MFWYLNNLNVQSEQIVLLQFCVLNLHMFLFCDWLHYEPKAKRVCEIFPYLWIKLFNNNKNGVNDLPKDQDTRLYANQAQYDTNQLRVPNSLQLHKTGTIVIALAPEIVWLLNDTNIMSWCQNISSWAEHLTICK